MITPLFRWFTQRKLVRSLCVGSAKQTASQLTSFYVLVSLLHNPSREREVGPGWVDYGWILKFLFAKWFTWWSTEPLWCFIMLIGGRKGTNPWVIVSELSTLFCHFYSSSSFNKKRRRAELSALVRNAFVKMIFQLIWRAISICRRSRESEWCLSCLLCCAESGIMAFCCLRHQHQKHAVDKQHREKKTSTRLASWDLNRNDGDRNSRETTSPDNRTSPAIISVIRFESTAAAAASVEH